MTGGQNHVVFWTLRPNLSSRLGKATTDKPPKDATIPAEQQSSEEAERAPASNEAVVSVSAPPGPDAPVFSSAEKAMAETFTCGVAIGSRSAGEAEAVAVAVTGTASGAFAVWENLECVKMVQDVHGA